MKLDLISPVDIVAPLAEARGDGVRVRIRRPCAALQSYVTFFYVVEVDRPLSDFLYPEWGNIRFALHGDWIVTTAGAAEPTPRDGALFGPTDKPGRVETHGAKAIGFGLTPLAWRRLIGGDASGLANRIVPLDDQLGIDGAELRRHLERAPDDPARVAQLEARVAALCAQRPPLEATPLAIDRALRGRPATMAEFAMRAGLNERTLHRNCLRIFGFAPKRLMRLQRFLDTLGRVRSAVGGSIRDELGDSYIDEPHFYRDFRDFMGMTPKAYLAAPRPLMGPAAEAQMRAGVTLSFRLPPQPGER